MKTVSKVAPQFHADCKTYALKPSLAKLLMLLPILIVAFFCLAWFLPETYFLARWASKENGPAENLTFLLLLFGSIFGLRLSARLKAKGVHPLTWGFLALFSVGILLVAMEEIAWGQQFLQFETPESLMQINEQNELTLHNLEGLQGHSEYFHLVFGLAGLISICFNLHLLNRIRVPRLLAPLFFTIAAVSLYDLLSDHFLAGHDTINYFTRRLSEINEMLIGIAAFAYILLLVRKFRIPKSLTTQLKAKASVTDAHCVASETEKGKRDVPRMKSAV